MAALPFFGRALNRGDPTFRNIDANTGYKSARETEHSADSFEHSRRIPQYTVTNGNRILPAARSTAKCRRSRRPEEQRPGHVPSHDGDAPAASAFKRKVQ